MMIVNWMPRIGVELRLKLGAVMIMTLFGSLLAQASEEQVHREGDLRVRYHTEGEHAIPLEDRNHNGIPDRIEDIVTQVQAAQILFVEVLGFPDPLKTERFRSATVIDIGVVSRERLKGNGVAFDELQRSEKGDWIGMRVASSVDPSKNMTPAHELFHLIQFSTSYFKNRWYTEGMARWSERALGLEGLGPAREFASWPLSEEEALAVFERSYDASEYFWNPLVAMLDQEKEIPETEALRRLQEMRYTDGSPVLKDLKLSGWKLMRDIIIELGVSDKIAYRELEYDRWSEVNQFSPQNNQYILRSVEKVVHRHQQDRGGVVSETGGASSLKARRNG